MDIVCVHVLGRDESSIPFLKWHAVSNMFHGFHFTLGLVVFENSLSSNAGFVNAECVHNPVFSVFLIRTHAKSFSFGV